MNFSGAGLTYALLIVPTLFALAVVGQGIYKLNKHEESGKVIVSFGLIFLFLIVAAYFFFIR